MTDRSEKFEKQIARIHHLIAQHESVVTWNDYLPDPDNPDQSRQIDITIKRDDSLTLVECRIHERRQDVQWIEEIIGRRVSLHADAVIAVSASGFTEGARRKADVYGIMLRDFRALTEEEIEGWGKKTRVWVTYHEYTNVRLALIFHHNARGDIRPDNIGQVLEREGLLHAIFNLVSKELDARLPNMKSLQEFECKLTPGEQFRITGHRPLQIMVHAHIRTVNQGLSIPSVFIYDAPGINAKTDNAIVEELDFGDFEITQWSNKVLVTVDLSPINPPENCHFWAVMFDFQRPVTMEGVSLIGRLTTNIPLKGVGIHVSFQSTQQST